MEILILQFTHEGKVGKDTPWAALFSNVEHSRQTRFCPGYFNFFLHYIYTITGYLQSKNAMQYIYIEKKMSYYFISIWIFQNSVKYSVIVPNKNIIYSP